MYASVLYELRESDFLEIGRAYDDLRIEKVAGRNQFIHMAYKGDRNRYLVREGDQKSNPTSGSDRELHPIAGDDQESHPIPVSDQE